MRKFSSLILLVLLSYSCGSGVDTKALRDEVLDIHDEVMPKIGVVMSLRKRVMTRSQELALTENFDQSEVSSLDSLANALEVANKGMMGWMNDWSQNFSSYIDQEAKPLDGIEIEEVIMYLEEEKERISTVKVNINAAIKMAREVLGN